MKKYSLMILLGLMTMQARSADWTPGTNGWCLSSGTVPHYYRQSDSQFRVEPARPRLYFKSSDLQWLRDRRTAAYPVGDRWNDIKNDVAGVMRDYPDPALMNDAFDFWNSRRGMETAFVALLDGNSTNTQWCIQWAKAMAGKTIPPADEADDVTLCGRVYYMAIIYDWLYPSISSQDRATIRDAIVANMAVLLTCAEIKNPSYTGGHERCYGYPALAAGALAVYGDYAGAPAIVTQCRKQIMDGMFPAQAWIAADGGYHMGYGYTPCYSSCELLYLIWTSGTTDVALDDWIGENANWFIYGLLKTGQLPESGDTFGVDAMLGNVNVAYAAGIKKSGQALWYLDNNGVNCKYGYPLLQFLFLDPAVTAVAPSGMALDKIFNRAGVVISRDKWSMDGTTTHFSFKSSPFYSLNHHHRDENTFTLFYKGALALDSGYYDSYNSEHWRNYYTRTVAHNGIVVYNPNQAMNIWGGTPISNDGGQIFKIGPTISNDGLETQGTTADPRRLSEIQPGGWASLDGVTRNESRTGFVYSKGDATKAYDPAWVMLAQRETVYLRSTNRTHPVVVILDRVGSTQSASEKRFLLHTVNQPVTSGSISVNENNGGRLSTMTLYPSNATIRTIGGPSQEFMANGTNYPLNSTPLSEMTPGAWRLEVAAPAGNTVDYFLHALFVDDSGAPAIAAGSAQLLSGTNYLGVQTAGWAIIFPKASNVVASLAYAVPAGAAARHLVTGLPAGKNVSVSTNGTLICVTGAGTGGCVEFDVAAQNGVTVSVSSADADADGIPDAADPDDDNDGMPDVWETSNGLNPLSAADANADADGDGMSNLAEYIAGTNPTGVLSRFQIAGAEHQGDNLVISFQTVTGRTYSVSKSDDLATPGWSMMISNVAGTGNSLQAVDTNMPSRRFYKLGVRTP